MRRLTSAIPIGFFLLAVPVCFPQARAPNAPPIGDIFQSRGAPDDRAKYVHGNWFDHCSYDRDHINENPLTRQYGQPDYVLAQRDIMKEYAKCAVDACAPQTGAVCWGRKTSDTFSNQTFRFGCQWDRKSLICQGLPPECGVQNSTLLCDATDAQNTSNTPPSGPGPEPAPYSPPPRQQAPQPTRAPGLPPPVYVQPVTGPVTNPVPQPPQTPAAPSKPAPPVTYKPQWLQTNGNTWTYRFPNGDVFAFDATKEAYGIIYHLQANPPPFYNHPTGSGGMSGIVLGYGNFRSDQGATATLTGRLIRTPSTPAAP